MLTVHNELRTIGLRAGIVCAWGVSVHDSPTELQTMLEELARKRKSEDFPPAPLKEAVRALLRKGGFKASGRNKPASEYLAQSAREDRFPFINNLVDINNLLSLETGLPISLLDGEVCGDEITLRLGVEGEKYVFNQSGHEIDLGGLICFCGAGSLPGEPLGNPVKDSIKGKLKSETSRVTGVVYSPVEAFSEEAMKALIGTFADLLRRFGGASEVSIQVE